MSLIEIEKLNLHFNKFHALKNVEVSIKKHTITALIGPSGCGKSTFLRTLNRMNDLIPGTKIEGKVIIDKQDIYDHQTDVNKLRKKVGMVFQKPTPFPKSIFENVAYGMRVDGETSKPVIEAKVEDSLKKAALWDEVKDNLKKSAMELSGGQQQRLCIARTLAIDSEVILMDEPTSALDPISTSKVEDLVKTLAKDFTIVIVTHNMQQATRISDKTAFFYLGELIEYGATEQIFKDPAIKRTRNYVNGIFG